MAQLTIKEVEQSIKDIQDGLDTSIPLPGNMRQEMEKELKTLQSTLAGLKNKAEEDSRKKKEKEDKDAADKIKRDEEKKAKDNAAKAEKDKIQADKDAKKSEIKTKRVNKLKKPKTPAAEIGKAGKTKRSTARKAKRTIKRKNRAALPKKVKKFNKGRDIARDQSRQALPPGHRISASGHKYIENRPGHADISKRWQLRNGGPMTPGQEEKFTKVLHEFKTGKLTSHGVKVKNRKQALAIAFSEAGVSLKKKSKGGDLGASSKTPPNIIIGPEWGNSGATPSNNEDYNSLYDLFPDHHAEAKAIWGQLSEKQKEGFLYDLEVTDAASEHIADSWLEFVNAKDENDWLENATNWDEYSKGGAMKSRSKSALSKDNKYHKGGELTDEHLLETAETFHTDLDQHVNGFISSWNKAKNEYEGDPVVYFVEHDPKTDGFMVSSGILHNGKIIDPQQVFADVLPTKVDALAVAHELAFNTSGFTVVLISAEAEHYATGGFFDAPNRDAAGLARDRKYLNRSEEWEMEYARKNKLRRPRYMEWGGYYKTGGAMKDVSEKGDYIVAVDYQTATGGGTKRYVIKNVKSSDEAVDKAQARVKKIKNFMKIDGGTVEKYECGGSMVHYAKGGFFGTSKQRKAWARDFMRKTKTIAKKGYKKSKEVAKEVYHEGKKGFHSLKKRFDTGGPLYVIGAPQGSAANHPIQQLSDELTDIGIDLEGEDESIIATLRYDLDEAFPDVTKANMVIQEFENDWMEDIHDAKTVKEVRASIEKYKKSVENIPSTPKVQATGPLRIEGGAVGEWMGGISNIGKFGYGKKGLLAIIEFSKKYPKNTYSVRDENNQSREFFWLKNGKFAKETVANPNYDFANNKVSMRGKSDAIYQFRRVNKEEFYNTGGAMKKPAYWISDSIKHKGILRKKAKEMKLIKGNEKLSMADLDKLEALGGVWGDRAREARTLMSLHK